MTFKNVKNSNEFPKNSQKIHNIQIPTWHLEAKNPFSFFTPFFTAVYIVERLVLQTVYVLNKEILQFLSLKSTLYNPEWFQIKSGF